MGLQALSWEKSLTNAIYMLKSTTSTSVQSTASTPTCFTSTSTCPKKQANQDRANNAQEAPSTSTQEALQLLEPRARKRRKQQREHYNPSLESAFMDETTNALISGPHSQYFSREGGDTICTMPNGTKCKVLPSRTIDFEDASNFQTLIDWQPLDAMLETTDGDQERADALASMAPFPSSQSTLKSKCNELSSLLRRPSCSLRRSSSRAIFTLIFSTGTFAEMPGLSASSAQVLTCGRKPYVTISMFLTTA